MLTMLDGLESATAGKVAVMMTAMDPNQMPPALLRSGRVELWLETTAPTEAARAEIVAAHVANLPEMFRAYDPKQITKLTEGFNAADMRRVVADVKALYAADILDDRKPSPVAVYFEIAARNVHRNKDLLGLAATGGFTFVHDTMAEALTNQPTTSPAAPAAGGRVRSEAERKASRIRDESNQCAGE